jgi:hypothetical protein
MEIAALRLRTQMSLGRAYRILRTDVGESLVCIYGGVPGSLLRTAQHWSKHVGERAIVNT